MVREVSAARIGPLVTKARRIENSTQQEKDMKGLGLAASAGPFLCVATALIAGCAARTSVGKSPVNPSTLPSANQNFTITATWNFDFTNFAPCSAAVTKGCVSSFTWGYLRGTTRVPLKTSAASVCAGSSTAAGSLPAQPETCTDTLYETLGIGPVVFYIVANYVDNAGNVGSTAADQSPQQNVALVSPTALAVSRH
jgi:hypothetical protein